MELPSFPCASYSGFRIARRSPTAQGGPIMRLRPMLPPQDRNFPAIPLRKFGSHDVQVSALGLGGHHLGDAADQAEATRIVHAAIEGGVTFFDNCWEYHRGKSESWMGA